MWIVALALRRPYTFVVLALLLLILGPIVIYRTPTDIFPNINIPVVSILWNYSGLNAQEMSNRIVTLTERTLTTTVDDIEHSESQSLNGIAVVKVFFQPHANIEKAIAQITAISQTQLRQLPPGRRRRWSSPTTRRRCRFCSWRCRGRNFPSSNSSTTA